jgi:hypothetical protein
MNASRIALYTSVAALLSLLTACASTPQPALDQANNGAALMMSLQAEVENFRTVQAAVMKERIAGIKRQQNTMATYEIDFAYDEKLLLLAGKKDVVDLYKALRDLSDSRIKDEQALGARLAEISASLDKLLTPLPEVSKEVSEAQKAMALLGEQLSVKERITIVADAAKALDKTIKDNKQKIDDAQAGTPAPASADAKTSKN